MMFMRKRSKNKKGKILKKILIVIGIIITLFIVVIVYFVIKDLKQEEILKQEIINYSNMDLAKDEYTIYVKTTGDYAYVEEAVKKFYKELSDNVKAINYYANDKELINILDPNNLITDRPNFIKSYNIIEKGRTKITSSINRIKELCSEDTIRNLIDKQKISDNYYYELYEDLMLTDNDIKELNNIKVEMEKLVDVFNRFFDVETSMLDLLKNNNSAWSYEDNQLYFDSDELVDKYNNLYKELNDISLEFDKEINNQDNSNKDKPTI